MSTSAPSAPLPAQAEIVTAGRRLAEHLPDSSPLRDPAHALDELMMATAAADDGLRTALFRFVDVRPACRTRRDVGDHLAALLSDTQPSGRPGRAAAVLARGRGSRSLVAALAGLGVQRLARRFIIGESVHDALPMLTELWQQGVGTSVDLLGEATVSEYEADAYARRCADSLLELHRAAARWPARPRLDGDDRGRLARTNLSVKVSALTPEIRPDAPRRGIEGAIGRLRELLRLARGVGAHVHIDMESLDSRETVLGLALQLLDEPEFRDGPSVGLVLQAYLRDSPQELERIMDWVVSGERSSPLTIRLVKGAYWDHEVVEARQHGWEVPVFEQRAECDRNFEELTRRLLVAHPDVRLAVASHNLRSIAHAAACLPLYGMSRDTVEFQVLRGLGDDVQQALCAMGLRVRTYCPIGDLVEGMAYLVRRMLENTANDSFLRARASGLSIEELMQAP